jgi:hypothetical protein
MFHDLTMGPNRRASNETTKTPAAQPMTLGNKARAERVVATLTRLRSVSDVGTVERELATLARGDARRERADQGSERHDAFIAIQALRLPLMFKHFGKIQLPRRKSGYRRSISVAPKYPARSADDARQYAQAQRAAFANVLV